MSVVTRRNTKYGYYRGNLGQPKNEYEIVTGKGNS